MAREYEYSCPPISAQSFSRWTSSFVRMLKGQYDTEVHNRMLGSNARGAAKGLFYRRFQVFCGPDVQSASNDGGLPRVRHALHIRFGAQ